MVKQHLKFVFSLTFFFQVYVSNAQQIKNVDNLFVSVFEGQRISVVWDFYTSSTSDTLIVKAGNTQGGTEYGSFKVLLKEMRSIRIISENQTNHSLPLFITYYVKPQVGSPSPTNQYVYGISTGVDMDLFNGNESVTISTRPSNDTAYAFFKTKQVVQIKMDVLNSNGTMMGTVFNGTLNEDAIVPFSVSQLPSGLYTVVINMGAKILTRKIVK